MKLPATPQLTAPQFGMSYKSLFYALPLLFLTGCTNPDVDTFQSQQESDKLSLVDQKQNARLDAIEARQLPQTNNRNEVSASRSDNTIQNAATRVEEQYNRFSSVSYTNSSQNDYGCNPTWLQAVRNWFNHSTQGWNLLIQDRDPFIDDEDPLHKTNASVEVIGNRLIANAEANTGIDLTPAEEAEIRKQIFPINDPDFENGINLCGVAQVIDGAVNN